MKIQSFLLCIFLSFMILPISVSSQTSLKVGSLIPLAGRWENSGMDCAKGILDASKWLNQRGGISGIKLEIILIEDTFSPAETMAAFRKLNEVDQISLLHIFSTETALDLLPNIHLHRIPTLVSFLPSYLNNPAKYPYLFSINPTALDLSKIAIKFISEKSGIKSRNPKLIFIGSLDYPNQYFLNDAKGYAKLMGLKTGPDIWVSHLFPSKDTTKKTAFLPLSTMRSYNADFAYLSLSSNEAFLILKEAKKMELQTRWLCSMKAFDESLHDFDGVIGVQPITPFGEDVPGMVPIKEAHQRWHPYDTHTLSYVEGWATIQVIAEALGRSLLEQGSSRERVKSSLESFKDFSVGNLIPSLTITAKDHRPSAESRMLIIKEGKISRLTDFISVGR